MKIFFDHAVVGTPHDFFWIDGSIVLGDDADSYDWKFSTTERRYKCVRAASDAAGCNLVEEPNIPQASFWKKHTQYPAWHRIASKENLREYIDRQINRIVDFVSDKNQKYYVEQFQVQQRLIDQLTHARIVGPGLPEHGFVPDTRGFVAVPEYDNCHSSTGRMTVRNGPKILTLPKDQRGCIISRWDDGVIVEVDFNALDARVLGWISGHAAQPGDMYEWIGSEAGISAPRPVIKEATLAAMYGMSRRNFALRYQDMPDAIDLYEKVRTFMRVRELEERLSRQETLCNAFGRPLTSTSARISHHVQSSSVDVACSGFDWLVQQVDKEQCLPIFLIHDALVLDMRQGYLPELESLCKLGLRVPIIDQSLPVKIRRF